MKTVFVSGCFDMLHPGHVEFLRQAANLGGWLFVAVGSDATIEEIKGKPPVFNERERLLMVSSMECVDLASISRGSGVLDFELLLENVHPDVFVVNEDGDLPAKRELCKRLGIDYIVLKRVPAPGCRDWSTTKLIKHINERTTAHIQNLD